MPQTTGSGPRPVAAATSARSGPRTEAAGLGDGNRPVQPSFVTSEENRFALGAQRSVWHPSEVTSLAATPQSFQAQNCG